MFCEECGTKNEKNASFCESCGHKLTSEEINKEVSKKVVTKPKKPMSKQQKIIISIVAIVLVALIGGYMYLGSLFTPEKIALKYFKAYTSKDANALYSTLNLDESKFVSKDLLKKSLKDEEKIKIANYSVVKNNDSSDDSLSKKVTIKYVEEGSSNEKTKTISLTKTKKKKWLLFDNWIVDSSEVIAKDYKVSVPKNSTVKINNISLSDKYKEDSSSSYYDNYTIPSILIGKYTIKVELESGITLQGEMNVSSGSYGTYKANDLSLDSKTEKEITKDITEKFKLLYDSAIEDKSFDDIKESFDEDYRDDISYVYDNIKSVVQSSYNTLKSIDITDITINTTSVDDEELKLSITMKYDYKVEYGYSDDNKTEYSKKNASKNYIIVKYNFKDKNYVMTNISSLPTYFSHYSY